MRIQPKRPSANGLKRDDGSRYAAAGAQWQLPYAPGQWIVRDIATSTRALSCWAAIRAASNIAS